MLVCPVHKGGDSAPAVFDSLGWEIVFLRDFNFVCRYRYRLSHGILLNNIVVFVLVGAFSIPYDSFLQTLR